MISLKLRLFWMFLYGWAFGYHGLLWIHILNEGSKVDLAVVTMALGLLFIWGVVIALIQRRLIHLISPKHLSKVKFFVLLILAMIGLALMAEVVSTIMTNTAYFWSLSPNEAYITASPNYIEVVTRHSVIVFIPQFLGVSLLHYRYQFKAFTWFILYGLVGYFNEWLAFGSAAAWVSIPFWMIIYGWIVYLPTHVITPMHERIQPKSYHYLLALVLPLLLSMPWALFVIASLHS